MKISLKTFLGFLPYSRPPGIPLKCYFGTLIYPAIARYEDFRLFMLVPGGGVRHRSRSVASGQSRYKDFRPFMLVPGRGGLRLLGERNSETAICGPLDKLDDRKGGFDRLDRRSMHTQQTVRVHKLIFDATIRFQPPQTALRKNHTVILFFL